MKQDLTDLAAGIRGFCISNPTADFEMVMDYVDAQLNPYEPDDAIVDLAMGIMLDVDDQSA